MENQLIRRREKQSANQKQIGADPSQTPPPRGVCARKARPRARATTLLRKAIMLKI